MTTATQKPPPPPPADLASIVDALVARVDALERVIRMQGQHRTNPVVYNAGSELRRARKFAGWAIWQLAVALKTSRQTLTDYELDRHPIPEWRAQQIAACFAHAGAQPPDFARFAGETKKRRTPDPATVRCHWCREELPLVGRGISTEFPCCGSPECGRAYKRKHAAERRARQRGEVSEGV